MHQAVVKFDVNLLYFMAAIYFSDLQEIVEGVILRAAIGRLPQPALRCQNLLFLVEI